MKHRASSTNRMEAPDEHQGKQTNRQTFVCRWHLTLSD